MWNDTVLEALRTTDQSAMDLSSINLGTLNLRGEFERKTSAHWILEQIKHLPHLEREAAVDLIADGAGSLPNDLMLTTEQLKELQLAGIEIGAHTRTHPILSSIRSDDLALGEIDGCKSELEKEYGVPVRYFAYPNGKPGVDYLLKHRDMVQDIGFEAALSTTRGVSSKESDRWQLPRFTPWDTGQIKFLFRLLANQRKLVRDLAALGETL